MKTEEVNRFLDPTVMNDKQREMFNFIRYQEHEAHRSLRVSNWSMFAECLMALVVITLVIISFDPWDILFIVLFAIILPLGVKFWLEIRRLFHDSMEIIDKLKWYLAEDIIMSGEEGYESII